MRSAPLPAEVDTVSPNGRRRGVPFAPVTRRKGGEAEVVVPYELIEALQEREHQLAEAQRLTHLGSWSWDLVSGAITWSDELYRILRLTPQETEPSYEAFLAHVHPEHRLRVRDVVRQGLAASASFVFDAPVTVPGGVRWIHCLGDVVTDATGAPARAHGTVQDITESVETHLALRESERRLAALVRGVSEVVVLYEPDGTERFASTTLELALGHAPESHLHGDPWRLVHPDDLEDLRAGLAQLQDTAGHTTAVEFRAAAADGSWRTFEARGRNATKDPNVRGTIVTLRDVTESRTTELVLAQQALHDPLTGLANRAALMLRAHRALARADRTGWSTAMLLIDLDGFHAVNDRFGHDDGDRLLVEVARRLDRIFRPYDTVARSYETVARVGADEFLVVCEQVADEKVAETLGARVADALDAPVDLPAGTVRVTAGVGVVLAEPGQADVEELVRRAGAAMRAAKREGPGRCQVFTVGVTDELVAPSHAATEELRQALERGQLRLVYQPKMALETGRVTGAEALLRWDHPERGVVPPDVFIPLAEETGLIVPIGAWVIEDACRQAARWRARFPDHPGLVISVNVSALQFTPGLSQVVRRALAANTLDPAALCLEVTESILMSGVEVAVGILQELAEIGVGVSIDDFGTGYSSLAYLKQFPLDELKIDKSFVDGLGADPNDTAIVAAVIAMAHALDLRVVAEGVETRDQEERLRTLGCEQIQGYHFARPGPPEAVAALVGAEMAASWQTYGAGVEGGRIKPEVTSYRPQRVLIIDDTSEVRQLARMSLAAVGFEVHEAADGMQGIDVAHQTVPDCVLLDLVMPDMTGFDVCRALRADPSLADLTIIMLTSNAEPEDKIEAFASGADDYVIKPFSPRDLAGRVRAAMTRRIRSYGDSDHVGEESGEEVDPHLLAAWQRAVSRETA